MVRSNILGSTEDRKKTSIVVSEKLLAQIRDACNSLGIPMNAFFSVSSALFLLKLRTVLDSTKKRRNIWKELASEVQKVVDTALEVR